MIKYILVFALTLTTLALATLTTTYEFTVLVTNKPAGTEIKLLGTEGLSVSQASVVFTPDTNITCTSIQTKPAAKVILSDGVTNYTYESWVDVVSNGHTIVVPVSAGKNGRGIVVRTKSISGTTNPRRVSMAVTIQ